jgi:hypothetical protein
VTPSGDVFADLPEAADLLDLDTPEVAESLITMESVPAFHESLPEPVPVAPAAPEFEISEPAAAAGQAPAAPGQGAFPIDSTPASSEQARAVVQALLADPVLVDALVKAVVSRMGDQVLREIAWEVMPDLAGRLQQ